MVGFQWYSSNHQCFFSSGNINFGTRPQLPSAHPGVSVTRQTTEGEAVVY